jgi:hypothetical protein
MTIPGTQLVRHSLVRSGTRTLKNPGASFCSKLGRLLPVLDLDRACYSPLIHSRFLNAGLDISMACPRWHQTRFRTFVYDHSH